LATLPLLSIADLSMSEGDQLSPVANLEVTLSAASGQDVTVTYATADGTATAPSDYQSLDGLLYIPAGATTGKIGIPLSADYVMEEHETFSVVLGVVTGATLLDDTAVVTIWNDDVAGFSIDDIVVTEPRSGTAIATFTVTNSPPIAASVNYATANQNAQAGSDYVAASGTLVFTTTTPSLPVSVTVNADALAEGEEWFFVNLSGLSGNLIGHGTGIARIRDPGFYTIDPCRAVDTRTSDTGPALFSNGTRTFLLRGPCVLPFPAPRAASVNITVTSATSAGNLRLFAGGSPVPLVSNINYSAGQTRANNAIVPLGKHGTLGVRCDQLGGSVHLLVDVNGYFE
jgi:hypothetical protein